MIRPSGHVAQVRAGSLVLSDFAVERLARHLSTVPESHDLSVRAVVADILRLSGHVSRDPYHEFASGAGESELSTSQAAYRLGISADAVRKRISRGTLPAIFNGRRWVINPDDLER